MVQKPVKAVILLFPITDGLAASRKEEDAKVAKGESGPPVDPTLVFIKQTVRVSRTPPQNAQHCLMQIFSRSLMRVERLGSCMPWRTYVLSSPLPTILIGEHPRPCERSPA